ncbi:MAG: LLM class flavin-dependent oxidoreductase [Candidatus Heimdallarchaeota archaeon]|nr:LLM class flavin-dependent oxidoreductase [Candidatus Heimdallarchaeota archaeon]
MDTSFGVQLEPQFGYTKKNVDEIASFVEKSSFDTVWVSDHMFLDKDAVGKSAFDALTLMTYLGTKFSQLRVGSLVFCNSYRQPSVMAKKIATLDNLVEGRLEVGYGAGWKEIEYGAYGIPFPSVKTRLKQLVEGLEVLQKMWTEEKASYKGDHYTLDNAICYPKPYQKPYPRLWIGTMYGKKKMLQIAAKYGDGINLAWAFTVDRCEKIFQQLDEYTNQLGRQPLKRSLGFWVRIYSNEEEMTNGLQEEAKKRNITLDDYKKRIEGALIGTTDIIIKKLKEYKNLGVTHFIFMFPSENRNKELEYLEIFNNQILPKV